MNKSTTIFFSILLAFVLLYANQSKAQYTLTPSKICINYQSLNNLSYDSIHIANNSADTLNMKWELIQNDILAGTSFDFCSSGNCWIGIPASGSFPPIVPGGFGWAGVHLWTGNTVVTITAKLWLYKEGSYTTGDTITYILHAVNDLGIDDKNVVDNAFNIYPNPAKDILTIKCTNNTFENIKLQLTNVLGEVISTNTIKNSITEIPLNGIAEGIYFLTIISGNNKFVKKIIVSGK